MNKEGINIKLIYLKSEVNDLMMNPENLEMKVIKIVSDIGEIQDEVMRIEESETE